MNQATQEVETKKLELVALRSEIETIEAQLATFDDTVMQLEAQEQELVNKVQEVTEVSIGLTKDKSWVLCGI